MTGEPTGWFEPLYAARAAAGDAPPWHSDQARPLLVEWATAQGLRGEGRRAAVVGAGLGTDAEYVASLGFDTLGFDVSPTAVRLAGERSTHPNARYEVGDLFALPSDWLGAFDLVVEIWTVQALPVDVRAEATAAIASLVAPGGRLFAMAWARADDAPLPPPDDPPWPLTRAEFDAFGAPPLRPVEVALVDPCWRGEFLR
ncbi:MAG TPA: class I SAM-dependent methyltransferase [Baekduia sp.]|uniref:class I SAM-dependent methyltransferase n=1 Tax=Baekduia sp. TaxID=2600305 RepID=UPI002D78C932|nr:class I SAM-dependent methyltransferase [Baekduia sp.]HET6507811.1 class I SAM-dependent methyltransferase [Baekduia sp.]